MADHLHVRQSSLLTAIHNGPHRTADRMYIQDGRACLALVATAAVAINVWALFPSPDESGKHIPLPDVSRASAADLVSAMGGGGGVATPLTFVRTEMVQFMKTTTEPRTAAAPSPGTVDYPNLLDALSRVPVKAKLQALLALLVSQTDPAERADLEAKLLALLKLPDYILLEVLQHPDLADFGKMLDAVFLGETELWWIESQLEIIDVVPVTTTSDRIDISGKPAYMFDSTVAHNGDGGQATPALKPLAPSSAPQGALMKVSQTEEDAGFSTFAAPVSSDVQVSQFAMSAPVVDVVPSAALIPAPPPPPSPAPSPAPVASPAPAPTNAEISRELVETQPTTSPDVFEGGNRFEQGPTASEPTAQNTPASETATPSTTSPDAGINVNPPSGARTKVVRPEAIRAPSRLASQVGINSTHASATASY